MSAKTAESPGGSRKRTTTKKADPSKFRTRLITIGDEHQKLGKNPLSEHKKAGHKIEQIDENNYRVEVPIEWQTMKEEAGQAKSVRALSRATSDPRDKNVGHSRLTEDTLDVGQAAEEGPEDDD